VPQAITSVLSGEQLDTLRRHGEERRAAVGDVLFQVGDERYPLIAILEGEAAVLDSTGAEIIRHGPSGFLGELNLLSGQTVYLSAVATQPMRYIAVEREALRSLLLDDSALSDVVLSTFVRRREILQGRDGVGVEIVGPRSDEATRRTVEWARRNRLPHVWRDSEGADGQDAAALTAGLQPHELPLVVLPGGRHLRRPTSGELSRALGIGLVLGEREEVDLLGPHDDVGQRQLQVAIAKELRHPRPVLGLLGQVRDVSTDVLGPYDGTQVASQLPQDERPCRSRASVR